MTNVISPLSRARLADLLDRMAGRRAAVVGDVMLDRYLMGDYPDGTDFGPVAALFLHEHGITESFPLPGNRRR